MLNARIELRGEELFCADTGEGGLSTVRRLTPEALARLRGWAERYDAAVRTRALPPLVAIGRDIADFLDEGDRWLGQILGGTIGEIALDIVVPGQPEERERILLDIPWELLAPNGRFLADDDERLFRVTRRLGTPGTPAPAEFRDLSLLFVAAEVEGQGVLDYEQEEAGILQATNGLPLNLSVEESGAIEFLGQRIAQDGPFEALHLSCHGDIVKGRPVLALEKPEGGLDLVGIDPLSRAFGEEDKKPKLVFLSACRTGEHGAASAFVQSLVRSGVANAIGWDGSVNDADAIGFAATFYEELARGSSVAYAAARARGALLRAHLADPDQSRHWHLARAYSGPRGDGTLCAAARPRRVFRRDAGYKEFLDLRQRRVPVASAAEFVGRRREAQRILRAFRDREGAGVLIHGLGRQGKSSLAARIANRMPGHDTVVIYERYDALAVFEALRNALPARLQRDFDQTWREQVTKDASNLQHALLDMLEGPFRTTDPATRAKPVLLIVDDLEQILETPKPGEARTPVKTNYSVALASIIAAFRDAGTESRLLLTSRYTFALTDSRGDDLAARLAPVQLPPMDETQRDKQMRAAARLAGAPPAGAAAAQNRAALEARIKPAANGNPGLQAILSRPMLNGDSEATIRAVEAVESYLKSGEIPEDSHAAADFFTHVSLTAFRDMLMPQETQQLRAATLFSVPVPRPVLEAAGEAASVTEPGRAIDRLRGLGLIDVYLAGGAKEELVINSLARPLVPALSEAESAEIAEKAIAPLYSGWKNADGDLPVDLRGWEAARLAMLGEAPADIVNAASRAAAVFLFHTLHQAEPALDLVLAALSALDRAETVPDLHLLRLGADCAERLGKAEIQEMLLERGLAIEGGDPRARAMLLSAKGSRLIRTGQIDAAEGLLREAAAVFQSIGDVRSRAVTMGRIADILQARGQLDEALKIRQEELPVYERLGDVRSRAVTMGQIADILQARGQLDEALKIRIDEELPVYERLGDVRERAVTMGQIADILQARGQLDEALKIRNEEELPVYERLGDVRERAVTMGKIADILQARGQLDEALKIRNEEELPIYERLGDVSLLAMTMGQIADILQARGQIGEALQIRQEKVFPAFTRLGNPRLMAVEKVKIAEILEDRGEIDQAEKLLDEAATTFSWLGDIRQRAVTIGRLADILQARGQLDEALKIRTEEQLPVYERLGDVRSRAVTMGQIADILQARGQLDEALKIRTEEELPVYERLGDVRSRAVTMGKIANILQARGQLDEALAMHSDRLAVAEAMGDIDSIAHVKSCCAAIRLERGGWEKGEGETIVAELAESFSIAQRMKRVDFIASIGAQFGQVLLMAGKSDEGLGVLEEAAGAFESLQQIERAQQLRALQGQIRTMLAESPEETTRGAEIEELGPPPAVEMPFDPVTVPPPAPPPPPVRGLSDPGTVPAVVSSSPLQVDNAEYMVWYGTNRRPNDPGNVDKGYSAARDSVVHYGSCRVFIPQSHKIGSIGSPWWKRLLMMTDDRLRLLGIDEFQQSVYWDGIAAQLAAIDADERSALVFVHGYNVSFQAAALRAAQIGFDLSVKGAMAFFSWPSQGSTRGYPADEATIEASEGVIANFMTDFAERSGAAAVHIIAHSMGNRGVLRAVNRIAAKAERRTGKPFGQVILAAADVDADVFRQLSAAYAEVASRTTLYVSKRDLAVEASRWLHNFPRAGLMPPTLVLPGIDTINVTNVDLTMLGHGYVAEARDVLTDMHALITHGAPPNERFGLREAKNEEDERYWLIGA